MPDPAPLSAGSAEPLHLACPICGGALYLQPAHLGVEGYCPVCQTPIVARRAADGSVTVHGLFPTILGPLDPVLEPEPVEDAAAPPPNPNPVPAPVPQAPEPALPRREMTRARERGGFPLWITGLGLLIVAAAVALHFSRPPEEASMPSTAASPTPPPQPVPEPPPPPPAPVAAAAPVPAPPPVAAVAVAAAEPPPAEEPAPPGFAETAVATIRDFLSATRPWEKLLHVLEPEEDLLSILAFQELAAVSAETDVRHLATRRSDAANGSRWVSHLEWTESDGTARNLVVVHRDGDRAEAAKFDFSLYWQNRSDVLAAFRDRKTPGKPLEVRVLLRRDQATGDDASVWELAQPDTEFPPVSIPLDPAAPLAAELASRVGAGESVPAVLELAWGPGETDAPTMTISRLVRWGWWPAWEGG